MSYLYDDGADLDPIETWESVQRVLSDLLGCDESCIRPHTTLPDLFKPFDMLVVASICAALETDLDFYIDEDSVIPFFTRSTATAGDLARELQKLRAEGDLPDYYHEG